MSDAGGELIRAIRMKMRNFVNFDGFTLERISSRNWASATFTGARHELAFALEGEGAEAAADDLLSRLGETEFDLRSHIVADIALIFRSSGDRRVRIALEALTVEEG